MLRLKETGKKCRTPSGWTKVRKTFRPVRIFSVKILLNLIFGMKKEDFARNVTNFGHRFSKSNLALQAAATFETKE